HVDNVRVFFRLLERFLVISFGVVGHCLANIPPLPEHPAINCGSVGNKRSQSLFFLDLLCQNISFESLLIRNFTDTLTTALFAQGAAEFRYHLKMEKRSQLFHECGFADSACASDYYSSLFSALRLQLGFLTRLWLALAFPVGRYVSRCCRCCRYRCRCRRCCW